MHYVPPPKKPTFLATNSASAHVFPPPKIPLPRSLFGLQQNCKAKKGSLFGARLIHSILLRYLKGVETFFSPTLKVKRFVSRLFFETTPHTHLSPPHTTPVIPFFSRHALMDMMYVRRNHFSKKKSRLLLQRLKKTGKKANKKLKTSSDLGSSNSCFRSSNR